MSVVTTKTDRLSVFHSTNGKHAGTLEFRERIDPADPTSSGYAWTWDGGPFGPQSGFFQWTDLSFDPSLDKWFFENPCAILSSLRAPGKKMFLINYGWKKGGWPYPRPWFKWTDRVVLNDPNFPHLWRCKLIQAA